MLGLFIYLPIGLILVGIIWYEYQVKKYDNAIRKIVRSVSLPDSATFKDYALYLRQQIKPGFKAQDVHKLIRERSKIDTVHYWRDYYEIYKYDLPIMDRFLKYPSEIVIIYDSTWTFKDFSFEGD